MQAYITWGEHTDM